jgi:UDPglucose--hexose-1-phosphate uridylyltransferase
MPKSQIRKHYFLEKYAIIAPKRSERPHNIPAQVYPKKNASSHCVFCPQNVEKNLLIQTYGQRGKLWQFAVLKNKFPAVSPNFPDAYGRQEVLLDTPIHGIGFSDLGEKEVVGYLKVMSDRLKKIQADKKINYILQFKNEGSGAGATLPHSHSQIFASSLLPPDIKTELDCATDYKKINSICPYCDILVKELAGPRKIFEDKNVGAFCPFASTERYEAWLFTKRHIDNITVLTENELISMASAIHFVVAKLKKLGLDYNFFMHQVVSAKDQHFYMKFEPRKDTWAGIELGSGLIVNPVAPEEAALFYRK